MSLEKKEAVILMHGLAHIKWGLRHIEHALKQQGYKVVNLDYPSRKYTIPQITKNFLLPVFNKLSEEYDIIHLIGHSMGSIIIRYFKEHYDNNKIGNLVQITPPNNGSELASFAYSYPLLKFYFGPALNDLVVNGSIYNLLTKEPNYKLGIIAAKKSRWPFTIFNNTEDNDGIISLNSMKLKNTKDIIILNEDHLSVLNSKATINAIIKYLKEGKF